MEFEKYIKENTNDQHSEIDATKMWDKVSTKIEFKKKKRRPFIFWIPSIVIITMIVTSVIMFSDILKTSDNAIADRKENLEKAVETVNKRNSINPVSNEIKSGNPPVNTIDDLNATSEKITNNTTAFITSNYVVNTDLKSAQNITTENNTKSPLTITTVNNRLSENKKNRSHDKINTNNNIYHSTYNTPLYLAHNTKTKAGDTTGKDNFSSIKSSSINGEKLNNTGVLNTTNQHKKLLKYNLVSTLVTRPLFYNRDKLSLEIEPFSTLPSTDKNINTNPFSMTLYTGIGISKKGLTSVDKPYEVLRNDTERTLEHFNITADLQYHLNKNWSIGSGLDYLSLTEKFQWNGSYTETINGSYVDTIYYSTKTDSTLSFKSGDYNAVINREMVKYNCYQFINIPISLQYSFQINRNHFHIQPAVLFNVAYKAKGDYINTLGIPDQLEDLKTSVGLQYQMSLNYGREIGNTWKWSVGTSLRWTPDTSLGQNAQKTESSYLFYNLRMGLIKRF